MRRRKDRASVHSDVPEEPCREEKKEIWTRNFLNFSYGDAPSVTLAYTNMHTTCVHLYHQLWIVALWWWLPHKVEKVWTEEKKRWGGKRITLVNSLLCLFMLLCLMLTGGMLQSLYLPISSSLLLSIIPCVFFFQLKEINCYFLWCLHLCIFF